MLGAARITTLLTTPFQRRVACDLSYCPQSAVILTTVRELASSLMMVAEVLRVKAMGIQLSSGDFNVRGLTV